MMLPRTVAAHAMESTPPCESHSHRAGFRTARIASSSHDCAPSCWACCAYQSSRSAHGVEHAPAPVALLKLPLRRCRRHAPYSCYDLTVLRSRLDGGRLTENPNLLLGIKKNSGDSYSTSYRVFFWPPPTPHYTLTTVICGYYKISRNPFPNLPGRIFGPRSRVPDYLSEMLKHIHNDGGQPAPGRLAGNRAADCVSDELTDGPPKIVHGSTTTCLLGTRERARASVGRPPGL